MELQTGNEITINGRGYTVDSELHMGEATKRCCPWLKAQFAVTGRRGAKALLQEQTDGILKLIFIRGGRVEVQYPAV